MEQTLEKKEVVQEKPTVEIIDEPIVEKEDAEIDLSELSAEERVLAEKHGIKEKEKVEDEHKEQQESAAKSGNEEKEVKEEVTALPTFEEIENNEEHLSKFNPNEKALYWKWKNDKRKRQDAQRKADELQARLELETVKDKSSSIKLKRIKEVLGADSEITVDKLLGIIEDSGGETNEENNRPITKADLDKIESEKLRKINEQTKQTDEQKQRLAIAEQIGKTKYKDFDNIVNLAKEVVFNDKTGTYQEILNAALSDPNFDEEKLIDRVVTIAKLSDKFGKDSTNAPEKKEKVEKVVENSKKKISSASISSSGGKRIIVEDDLTVEDAARLSPDQWIRLSPQTRKRILGG